MIFNSIHYFDLIWFLIWFLQGPCKGDDGGPLYINGKTNSEGDIEGQTLAAINSGAAGKCGKAEYPAWWTRVISIYFFHPHFIDLNIFLLLHLSRIICRYSASHLLFVMDLLQFLADFLDKNKTKFVRISISKFR